MAPGRFFTNNYWKWPRWVHTVRDLLLLHEKIGRTTQKFIRTLWYWITLVDTNRTIFKILQDPGNTFTFSDGWKGSQFWCCIRMSPFGWRNREGVRRRGTMKGAIFGEDPDLTFRHNTGGFQVTDVSYSKPIRCQGGSILQRGYLCISIIIAALREKVWPDTGNCYLVLTDHFSVKERYFVLSGKH